MISAREFVFVQSVKTLEGECMPFLISFLALLLLNLTRPLLDGTRILATKSVNYPAKKQASGQVRWEHSLRLSAPSYIVPVSKLLDWRLLLSLISWFCRGIISVAGMMVVPDKENPEKVKVYRTVQVDPKGSIPVSCMMTGLFK